MKKKSIIALFIVLTIACAGCGKNTADNKEDGGEETTRETLAYNDTIEKIEGTEVSREEGTDSTMGTKKYEVYTITYQEKNFNIKSRELIKEAPVYGTGGYEWKYETEDRSLLYDLHFPQIVIPYTDETDKAMRVKYTLYNCEGFLYDQEIEEKMPQSINKAKEKHFENLTIEARKDEGYTRDMYVVIPTPYYEGVDAQNENFFTDAKEKLKNAVIGVECTYADGSIKTYLYQLERVGKFINIYQLTVE